VLALLLIAFPIALILAWSLELTPEGVRAESSPGSNQAARVLDYSVLVIILIGLAWFAVDRFGADENDGTLELDKSVAILPFINLNDDDANAAFTSGIHADLLTQLARIKSVRTVSRTTVLKYRESAMTIPEIADELGVATIVEGGVQRAGNSVRVNVQLIDAVGDRPLWTESFDRELTTANIFSIQREIARAIVSQLRARLSPEDERRLSAVPTQSIDALDAYFAGRELLEERTRESLAIAAEYFENVVALDPSFALGWSGLADTYMLLPEYSYDIDRNMIQQRSRNALLRALELDPSLPEVRRTEAWYQLTRNYDWSGAERIFRESLEDFPDNTNLLHWMSHTLSWQGRQTEGLVFARRALEVEPDSRLMLMNLAYILADARDYTGALRTVRQIRDKMPDYYSARCNLYLHELRAGEIESAADSYVAFTTIIGGHPAAARAIGDMFIAYARDGVVGDVTDELIKDAHLDTEDLAQILALVGDAEGAMAAPEVAINERSGSRSALSMKINPAYDFIRDDPRFDALLVKVGLADQLGK